MSNRRKGRKQLLQMLLFLFLIPLLLGLTVYVLSLSDVKVPATDTSNFLAASEITDSTFFAVPTIEVNGERYQEKQNVTAVLLIGYDKDANSATSGFRKGGQSDFLLLMVVDHEDKTVSQLQLERDTITDVRVLSVLGKDMGTNKLQLCLSHGYGISKEDCNERTVEAVSKLLHGVRIDFYASMNMDGIPVLNDLLGGVDVLIEDDFGDKRLQPGQMVHLSGELARIYLRARMSVGDGTNAERMRRHRMYLNAAGNKLVTLIRQSKSFANTFFVGMGDVLETNMSRGRMINEMNRAYNYDILPLDTIAGEYKTGRGGFSEFYASDEAIEAWKLHTFYLRSNNPVSDDRSQAE